MAASLLASPEWMSGFPTLPLPKLGGPNTLAQTDAAREYQVVVRPSRCEGRAWGDASGCRATLA